MENIGENIRIPLRPGRRVWAVNRGEIIPMKVSLVSIREDRISMTIIYDGDNLLDEKWNISELTEKDIGYFFFLSKEDAKDFLEKQ